MANKREAVAALLLYGAQRDLIDSQHLEEMMTVDWFREANCRFGERAMEGLALLTDRIDTFGLSMLGWGFYCLMLLMLILLSFVLFLFSIV
jgi:hypothetical protein